MTRRTHDAVTKSRTMSMALRYPQWRRQQLVAFIAMAARISVSVHGWAGGGSSSCSSSSPQPSSRRDWFRSVAAQTGTLSLVAVATKANVAAAASSDVSPLELERLQMGHARVRYLLDHWDEVTSVCGTTIMSDIERQQVIRTEGGGLCTKTPLRVQEFMGYKSTKDPLYKVDKFMLRASANVDPDNMEAYLDTVERYRETADATALLAYTSSWGEANPNGSKEVIDEYLDQTKAQVMESEKLLRSVLDYLQLKPLAPLQGKL